MSVNLKFLSWLIVVATFLVIFLPVQIASQSLSNLLMFGIGGISIAAQVLLYTKQEKTTTNKVQIILIMILTLVAMVLMYLMPTTYELGRG